MCLGYTHEPRRVLQLKSVLIQPHGRVIQVREGQSILDAALAAGLNLPHSCKSGHCSSCRARLLMGEVRYPSVGRPAGLTEAEARSGYVLLCQARALSDLMVEARLVANVDEVDIKTLPCRIARLNPLAADVMQIFLQLPAVERLTFQPGQYLDVLLEGGRRRSFSIASPPHDSDLIELHVRRVAGGGFTERLFAAAHPQESLQRGSLLRIEGPLGQFVYQPDTTPVLMIAGGTGFAPLKSMLRHVLEREPGAQGRPIHLYWGARRKEDLYEEERVLEWTRLHPRFQFSAVLSEEAVDAADPTSAYCRGGWVHEAVLADHPDLSAYTVYAAGPPAMIEAIRSGFPAQGLLPHNLHFDSFDYAPRQPGWPGNALESNSRPGRDRAP